MLTRRAKVLLWLAAALAAGLVAAWVAWGEMGLVAGLMAAAAGFVLMAYVESAHGSA